MFTSFLCLLIMSLSMNEFYFSEDISITESVEVVSLKYNQSYTSQSEMIWPQTIFLAHHSELVLYCITLNVQKFFFFCLFTFCLVANTVKLQWLEHI